MNFFENEFIIKNISDITVIVLISFLFAFILTPFAGRIAKLIGAVDKPASQRSKSERGYSTRLHTEPKPKLGGLAMVASIFLTIILLSSLNIVDGISSESIFSQTGIILGAIFIFIGGLLDDVFELSSTMQLFFHLFAGLCAIFFSIGVITNITFLGVDFNLSGIIIPLNIGIMTEIPLIGLFFTLIWIVGLINVINWVGGVDALNGSITSTVLITIMLIALSNGNILISLLIAIHLGSVLGVLPYNYHPAKIFYGSIGDYLNGYLLAIFAIASGTKWSTTFILLALPIIDAIYVLFMRFRKYPEYLRQPWKILSVSDRNHLHHRLIDSGFSPKMVTQIELTITVVMCSLAILTTDVRSEVASFTLGVLFLFLSFSIVFYLKVRAQKKASFLSAFVDKNIETSKQKEVKVDIIFKDEESENKKEEKFIY